MSGFKNVDRGYFETNPERPSHCVWTMDIDIFVYISMVSGSGGLWFWGPEARGRRLRSLPLPARSLPSPGGSGVLPRKAGRPGVLPRKNFEILHCCRWVLAYSGMLKVVWKCVFLKGAIIKINDLKYLYWVGMRGRFFGPEIGGRRLVPPLPHG